MSIHVNVSSLKSPEQYRRLAREAVQHAEAAPSLYFRLSYIGLAAAWRAIAEESEKASHAQLQSELSTLPEWAVTAEHRPI